MKRIWKAKDVKQKELQSKSIKATFQTKTDKQAHGVAIVLTCKRRIASAFIGVDFIHATRVFRTSMIGAIINVILAKIALKTGSTNARKGVDLFNACGTV